MFSCSFWLCGRILEMHQCCDETLEGAKLMCDVSVCSRPSSSSSSSSSLSLVHTYVNTHTHTHTHPHTHTHTHTHTFGFSAPVQKNNPNWASLFALLRLQRKTRTSPLQNLRVLDAQFSFDKCDVSVKLLMVLQDCASQTSKGIH